jgi:hypothetical protein
MKFNKVLIFVLCAVLGGLLQVWLTMLFLAQSGSIMKMAKMFEDGSLFFFSMSLLFGSVYTLFDKPNVPKMGAPTILTFLMFFFVAVPAISSYSIDMYNMVTEEKHKVPDHYYFLTQIICASLSTLYAVYIVHHTEGLSPADLAHFSPPTKENQGV